MRALHLLLGILSPRERQQALLLVPLVALVALAEVAGIASVLPFLALVADPSSIDRNLVLAWAFVRFGDGGPNRFLILVGIAVNLVLLLTNALQALRTYALTRYGTMRQHAIAVRLLRRYLQQPYAFFLRHNGSTLAANVVTEANQVVNQVLLPGLTIIARGTSAVAILALLILFDPSVAGSVGLVLGGTYMLLLYFMRRYLGRAGRERVRANQARLQAANEAFGAIKDLKLSGREGAMVRRFAQPSRTIALFDTHTTIIRALPRYVFDALAFGSIVLIVVLSLLRGESASSLLPVLGVYAFAGYRLLPALQEIFKALASMRYGLGALETIHATLAPSDLATTPGDRAPGDAPEVPEASAPLPFAHELRTERLSFRYAEGPPVLHDIDLRIPARSSVAFVGPTGSGKSTLIDLLIGLHPPSAGAITIDGVPLEPPYLRAWQRQIGYVPQAIFLLDDTVRRNIALGVPDAQIDPARVRAAAALAQVDHFIETDLPLAYDTVIGERGVRLSGGQRQRIGIARALYHDPAVLVLDEATSALDGETERALFDAIGHLAGIKTIVLIAHRLSTVEACDTVYLLEGGRISDSGRYHELLARSGRLQSMARQS
jgi:ATP-binding cassette, subfamily B, bacterial PglK